MITNSKYLRRYAEEFSLYTDGSSCWNKRGEKIIQILNDKIQYKNSRSQWVSCKEGDLLVCIINGIPL